MNPQYRRVAAVIVTGSLVVPLAACSQAVGATYQPPADFVVEGSFAGAGSTAQEKAMAAWIDGYTERTPGVRISYEAIGSGDGREKFLAGDVAFGASDSALDTDELASSVDICGGGNGIDLPVYISPISVAFNLEGIETLNLRADVIARIFGGAITTWNAPEIAADNPDVKLPDLPIVPVHRLDDSGTTENFTDYLSKVASADWPHEPDGVWPLEGGRAEDGTSGVTDFVKANVGAVTYADASATKGLGSAAIRVGDEFVSYTPEAAASTVDVSQVIEGRTQHDLAYDIDRRTTESFAYPLVLVSYVIVCSRYTDKPTGRFVKEFLGYIASPEGQRVAAKAAGSAPISGFLERRVTEAADAIYLG
ncbi:phosphate ABC transporter substrate-binding protein PstS [Myceligenerans crystallogenes]|uniref:Phosphate-binding protein n=1 Tax=Myceligenerans crystallogenes TaxID=316335 RepID=A0ABN2N9Y2_9MICO